MTKRSFPPRFLRTPEAARFLGLSGRTLEKHRYFGTGPAFGGEKKIMNVATASLQPNRQAPLGFRHDLELDGFARLPLDDG